MTKDNFISTKAQEDFLYKLFNQTHFSPFNLSNYEVSEQAAPILEKSYLRDKETPAQLFMRVASAVAAPLKNKVVEGDFEGIVKLFHNIMAEQCFLPNTPTLVNAGRGSNQLAACFVVPVGDSMEGIFAHAIPSMAMIQRTGGGTGFDFSDLRPAGALVSSTQGMSSGPVSFMEAFDACSQTIKQGGVRRGANMGILRVDHPDILQFIRAKEDKTKLTNFNLSVGITDDFMSAVEKNAMYDLHHDCKIYGQLNAKEVWDLICEKSWETGEPGVVFLDTINKANNLPGLGPIKATNPCLVGDTLIKTVEGMIPIKDLVGKEIDVYCVDDKYNLTISKAKDIRLTQKQAKLVEVVTTKGTVVCTPDHKFYTRNRGYIEAQDLTSKDKLVALNVAPKNQKYVKVYLTGTSAQVPAEHIFIAQHYYPDVTGKDTHHLDNNPTHNVFSNIEVLNHGTHSKLTNLGHPDWMDHDPATGRWVPNVKEPKDWSNKLGVHPVGANMRLLAVNFLDYTEDVYDMEVEDHHNFFANYVLVHNCGEQPLLPNEACNLGSINVASCIGEKDGSFYFDWPKLRTITRIATLFLDCVIDAGTYPLPEIAETVKANRKIGLGVMGFADTCFALELPYDSNAALSLAKQIMETIQTNGRITSSELGEWLGTFPNYDKSIFADMGYTMRNATITTIAPTGTIALLANTSYGMEPAYALCYEKRLASDDTVIRYFNKYLLKYMDNHNFPEKTQKQILTFVTQYGTLEGFDPMDAGLFSSAVAAMKSVFVTALEICPFDHVRMQAMFQEYVDNAVSKTINFANDVTVQDVKECIDFAYLSKCKGVTVYRTGSRDAQPLQVGSAQEEVMEEEQMIVATDKRQRPKRLPGITEQVDTGCGMMLVTVNMDEQGNIFEVLMKAGAKGGCAAFTDSTARLISIGLRYNVPIEVIIDQLCSVKCDNYRFQVGKDGTLKGKSCSDAVGRLLKDMLYKEQDNELHAIQEVLRPGVDLNDLVRQAAINIGINLEEELRCPECGFPLQRVEGCLSCDCGYSKC